MKQTTLYIGHNVEGVPTHTTAEVLETLERVLQVEAYTVMNAAGFWGGEYEQTTVCVFSAQTEEQAQEIIDRVPDLAAALSQECILCETRDVEAAFIAPSAIPAIKTA